MLYQLHELTRNLLAPLVHQAQANAAFFNNPGHWWSSMPGADRLAAMNELFHRLGKDYEKPAWAIGAVEVEGHALPVIEQEVLVKPFCRLLHFERKLTQPLRAPHPRVLIVAPMSGHYATLLRGTVAAMLPEHDVYITDWTDEIGRAHV